MDNIHAFRKYKRTKPNEAWYNAYMLQKAWQVLTGDGFSNFYVFMIFFNLIYQVKGVLFNSTLCM